VTSALAALLPFWMRVSVCESPRYLAATGQLEDAARVLRAVARRNRVAFPEGRLVAPPPVSPTPVAALWAPGLRRDTTMLWTAWFALALAYYGVFTWLPKIFVERGFDFVATYGYAVALAVAQLPGYFSAALLVERIGRRPTLALYLAASAVFTLVFAVVGGAAAIVTAAVVMSFFALGAWGALYAYTPELYPTEVRATGIGWASGMSRIAGALAPTIGGYLLALSLTSGLAVYAAAFAVGAVAVAVLGRETGVRAASRGARSRRHPSPA
jgi:putative MFS transporter